MSTNAQQIRTYTHPSDPTNPVNPFFLFMGLHIDALLLVARHLDYHDFENIALTCQYGNQQFQRLLANQRFNRYVLPTPRFLMNDRRKEATTLSLKPPLGVRRPGEWPVDLIMSGDGKWLFVLYASSHAEFRLDLFQQQSASPLGYRHVGQQHFSGNMVSGGYFNFAIVGQDPSYDNPGVYLTGNPVGWDDETERNKVFRCTRQIYSWHLRDNVSKTLKTVGARVPFAHIAVAHRDNGLRVYGIRYDTHKLETLTMNHNGLISENHTESALPLAKGVYYRLKLSPNSKCLAIMEEIVHHSGGYSHTLRVLTPNLVPILAVPFPLYFSGNGFNFSITDDGGSCIHGGGIIPLNGCTRSKFMADEDFIPRDERGSMAHNGTGSICIGFQRIGRLSFVPRQLFSQRKMLSGSHEGMLLRLQLIANDYDDHIGKIDQLIRYFSRPEGAITMSHLRSLQKLLNLRDARSLCTIFYELSHPFTADLLDEQFLFCLSDVMTLMEIIELSKNANLELLPRTGLVELALSSQGKALGQIEWATYDSLRDPLTHWFNNPFQIETTDIGTINSASFFWGKHLGIPQSENMRIVESRYSERHRKSERATQLHEIERAEIRCAHPLILLARETSDGVNFIEVCCRSRYPTLDNKRHKLIPARVVKLIDQYGYKNYLLLNALLKKIIELTFNPQQRARLTDTRMAMLQAVESNPSLRMDMAQLLTMRFYGKESVKECLAESPYYREIMEHLGSEEAELEPAAKPNRGRGCGF